MIGTEFDTATSALADKMLTHAENEINKYISKRYDISSFVSGSVPPLLTSLCETLAEGYMHQRMSRGGKESMKRGQDLIDGVIKNLEGIRDYKMDVANTAGSIVTDMSQTAYRVLSNTTGYSSTFNEDDPLNWKVDQDKLDDISDERD